jgi:cephalosporin-C deacetylase-like acetyl esterase
MESRRASSLGSAYRPSAKGKVPGMVLVHGGGGTAFKEWVQKWNAQGFAAISIAVEGQTDVEREEGRKAGPSGRVMPSPAPPAMAPSPTRNSR